MTKFEFYSNGAKSTGNLGYFKVIYLEFYYRAYCQRLRIKNCQLLHSGFWELVGVSIGKEIEKQQAEIHSLSRQRQRKRYLSLQKSSSPNSQKIRVPCRRLMPRSASRKNPNEEETRRSKSGSKTKLQVRCSQSPTLRNEKLKGAVFQQLAQA